LLHILLSAAVLLIFTSCDGLITPTGFDSFTAPLSYDTSEFSRYLEAAAVCMESSQYDKQANLDKIESSVETVMTNQPGTDVIVFPELCTGWVYYQDDPSGYFKSIAETIPGPSTDRVKDIALQFEVSIVFGLAEVDGSHYYNSQALLKADGSLVRYRKRGLNAGDILNGCSPGDGVVETDIQGVGITFIICSDYQDEAVIREVSVCDSPVVLASLVTATVLNPRVDFLTRSIGKWVVYSNGGGYNSVSEMPGNIFIADPTGTVRNAKSGPGAYSWFRIGVP